jgi:hypothetical protein
MCVCVWYFLEALVCVRERGFALEFREVLVESTIQF